MTAERICPECGVYYSRRNIVTRKLFGPRTCFCGIETVATDEFLNIAE